MTNPFENATTALNQISDADMAAFIGKDWDKFEPAWRVVRHKEKSNAMFGFKNINWLCLLAAPVWFAYRKMYLTMAVYIAATYALFEGLYSVFHIESTSLGYGLAIGIMITSRMIYFYVNAPRILAIRQSGGSEDEIKAKLATAGGVSNTSLAIGLLIVGLYVAYAFLYILPFTGNDINSVIDQIQHPQSEPTLTDAPSADTPPTDNPLPNPDESESVPSDSMQQDNQPTDGSINTNDPNIPKK